jgi:hypothetical protein
MLSNNSANLVWKVWLLQVHIELKNQLQTNKKPQNSLTSASIRDLLKRLKLLPYSNKARARAINTLGIQRSLQVDKSLGKSAFLCYIAARQKRNI